MLQSLLSVAALLYVALFLFGYFFANRLIFQPHASSYKDDARIIKISSGDGVQLSAIYLADPNARYSILYSHGNAEDIGDLMPVFDEIHRQGFNVLAYDYRGYGTSAGHPSEPAAYEDEDAAYDFLVKTKGIPPDRIIVLGRSLGGGVAVDIAARRPVGGLIVESSFVTAFRVLTRFPVLPIDAFRNIDKIRQVHVPVLVMHGKSDELIAFWHGPRLFREANEPKRSFWVTGAGHNDLFDIAGQKYGAALKDFAEMIDNQRKAP